MRSQNRIDRRLSKDSILGSRFLLVVVFLITFLVDIPNRYRLQSLSWSAINTIFVLVFFVFLSFLYLLFTDSLKIPRIRRSPVSYFVPFYLLVSLSLISHRITQYSLQNFASISILVSSLYIGRVLQQFNLSKLFIRGINLAIFISTSLYLASVVLYGFGNSVIYGNRSIGILGCIGLAMQLERPFRMRVFTYIATLTIYTAVISSQSRTASVVASIILFNVIRSFRGEKGGTKWFLIIISGFIAFQIIILSSLLSRFNQIGDNSRLLNYRLDSAGRLSVWRRIIADSSDNLLFGHGIGSTAEFLSLSFSRFAQPHNDYLRVLYDLGIVGVVCLVTPLFLIFVKSWFSDRNLPKTAASLVFVFGMFMLTDNVLVYTTFLVPYGICLGSVFKLTSKQRTIMGE